jgi:hypothetical protein
MKNIHTDQTSEKRPVDNIEPAPKKNWESPDVQEISRFSILGGIETLKTEGQGASFVAS